MGLFKPSNPRKRQKIPSSSKPVARSARTRARPTVPCATWVDGTSGGSTFPETRLAQPRRIVWTGGPPCSGWPAYALGVQGGPQRSSSISYKSALGHCLYSRVGYRGTPFAVYQTQALILRPLDTTTQDLGDYEARKTWTLSAKFGSFASRAVATVRPEEKKGKKKKEGRRGEAAHKGAGQRVSFDFDGVHPEGAHQFQDTVVNPLSTRL